MKSYFLKLGLVVLLLASCSDQEYADYYANPSKIQESTLPKQYAGFLYSNVASVVPQYWAYFTSYLKAPIIFTQSLVTTNQPKMYALGAGVMDMQWGYYNLLFQHRELEKIYNALPENEQKQNRIFMITALIYLYDFTHRTVDIYGDIPFFEAGKINQNGGNYVKSLPKYDKAEDIYAKILDDLKQFSDELQTISLEGIAKTNFDAHDFLNGGDVSRWRKYCNSLRFRMLNTVSDVDMFKDRAAKEMEEIVSNPTKYPLILEQKESIHYVVVNTDNQAINSIGFKDAFSFDFAGKKMIDYMNTNSDPRERVFFVPGTGANGAYVGLNPLLDSKAQLDIVGDGAIATVNQFVFVNNQKLPGEILNAAQVSFMRSEYFLRKGDDAQAKAAYETGIRQSIEYYFDIAETSDATVGKKPVALNPQEIDDYIASNGVKWDGATTSDDKMELIATQMWIHYGWMQPIDSWTDSRRMDRPKLNYWVDDDASALINLPPNRYLYAASEKQYNAANYASVAEKDSYTTKIFWDKVDYRGK